MLSLEDFKKKYSYLYDTVFDLGARSVKKQGGINADSSTIEDRAKAAWDKEPDLRFEFRDSFDNFLAFVKADEAERIRIDGRIPRGTKDIQAAIDSTGENLPIEDRAKAAWDKEPDLRFEFVDNFDAYLAFVKAEKAGQTIIVGGISRRSSK